MTYCIKRCDFRIPARHYASESSGEVFLRFLLAFVLLLRCVFAAVLIFDVSYWWHLCACCKQNRKPCVDTANMKYTLYQRVGTISASLASCLLVLYGIHCWH